VPILQGDVMVEDMIPVEVTDVTQAALERTERANSTGMVTIVPFRLGFRSSHEPRHS
jgi:hypothetical protein